MRCAVGNNLSILNIPFLPIVSVRNIPENSYILENRTEKSIEIHSIDLKHYTSFYFTVSL